ncbi:MAG: AraC family transcriptional regulator [Amylibacter sp.]|nr:AraC family transcriptional regulator [Amylibacter sp.]
MMVTSRLLFSPPELASCMAFAIVRDTRGVQLSAKDRLNYFPASPLVAFTIVFQGQLRVSRDICDLATLRTMDVLPKISVTPPQLLPTQSWSDGPIHVLTIGFYTDAWAQLGGDIAANTLPEQLHKAASQVLEAEQIEPVWETLCTSLGPIWAKARAANQTPHWAGSHKIADWTRHLLVRAALSNVGQSARSFERRMKRWTGQSQQALKGYAQMENLLALRSKDPDIGLASIAADAQFSDQSHMGRAVKKVTGFPPGRLNQLIETDEPFWCYRLLGDKL